VTFLNPVKAEEAAKTVNKLVYDEYKIEKIVKLYKID
jgi:hypothetical protein